MLQEFKKFILRGNVVDLAVAVVVGAAFSGLVTGFVTDFLNPLMGLIGGTSALSRLSFKVSGATFSYGHFLTLLVNFLMTAGVIFFFVMQPINHFVEISRKKQPTVDPSTRKCPECLAEVPIMAKRCMHCTSPLKPAAKKIQR